MGNDGGSIPTRRELVREAARQPSTAQLNQAQRELQSHFWSTCPLTHNPLTRPIVADCVGNLYNKDAILQFLLPGDEGEGSASGISSKADCDAILCGRVKGLRDVVELQFEIDSERREPVAADTNESREGWICPITAKQLGPAVKSVYLVPCGHVFSEEAVRQLKGDRCLQCNESYAEDNVIPVLPQKDEDKQRLMVRGRKLAEQGLTHSLKKAAGAKKRKKNASAAAAGDLSAPAESEGVAADSKTPAAAQPPKDAASRSNTSTPTPAGAPNGIKNAATATLTARVLDEENERKRRRKMVGTSDTLDSLFTRDSPSRERKHKTRDFMTRGYTIPAEGRR